MRPTASIRLARVALVLWVAFVWAHSLRTGAQSSLESDAVVAFLAPVGGVFGLVDKHVATLVVRKGAHLAEYAILGALAYGARMSHAHALAAPIAGCAVVATVDELLIQRMVPGRSGSVRDVALDVVGILVGIACCVLAMRAHDD